MNWILSYYQSITDGSVIVSQWIKKWYELVVKRIEDGTYTFSPKKANRAIKYIENFCRHHEGALAPGLIKLELWQKALLSVLFGILDKDGNRQFREAFVIIGRKNGKTLLAAAIADYMAFMDGEYGGRIYFAAPKLEQACLCYDAFFQMVSKEPETAALAKKRRSDVYIEQSNTTAKPLAFSAKKSDGLNISLCVADEVASWAGDQGLKFYEVLKSSFGARKQGLLLSISTASYINDGAYDELFKRATGVIAGTTSESRFAPFLYIIDDPLMWNDINELRKSNPNLGVSVTADYLLEEIAIAEGSISKKNEFLTKYCNIKCNSSCAWLTFEDVQKCVGSELHLEDFRNSYCVGGIDLSQTTDLTSACVVVEKSGELYVFSHFWMPGNLIQQRAEEDGVPYPIFVERGIMSPSGENYVDYHDVFNWFVSMVEQYDLYPLQVGFDRYSAQYLVDDMKAYGFHMDDVRQGTNLSPVIKEAEGIIKDGHLHIGDNSLLQAHLLNTALKTDEEAQKCRIIKLTGTVHIDGTAALLDALCVRQAHYADIGEQLRNEG